MSYEVIADARAAEMRMLERTMEQRRQWEELRTIDRLEHDLEVARARLSLATAKAA